MTSGDMDGFGGGAVGYTVDVWVGDGVNNCADPSDSGDDFGIGGEPQPIPSKIHIRATIAIALDFFNLMRLDFSEDIPDREPGYPVPNCLSPASPRPGTMNPFSLR
jgi:hypothetical protein